MEMTINKRLDIERRFFWLWNKTPLKPMKMKEVVADPNIHINDAYWINPNGEKCRDFPVGESVKLYLVLGNYNVGKLFNSTSRKKPMKESTMSLALD